MATAAAKAPVLNGPEDWHDWLDYHKDLATAKRVWNLVDPSLQAVPALVEPTIPTIEDVRPPADDPAAAPVIVIDLDDDERSALSIL